MTDIQVRVNQHRAKLILRAIANEAAARTDPDEQREYDALHAWLSYRYVRIYGAERPEAPSLPKRVRPDNGDDNGPLLERVIPGEPITDVG
jgi:hypothetical protein